MKCRNCKKDLQETMNYCPFCSCDLTNQVLKLKKRKKIVLTLTVIFLITIFGVGLIIQNINQLKDMTTSICNGEFDTIYTNKKVANQGIYQCKEDNYVYYVHDLKKISDFYRCGEVYELGYTYNEDIEKIFPDSIYLYRESRILSIASELKIALVANSEEELINNYAEKFYQLVENLNRKDIEIIIYFNNSLSGINTTYDKLFLMVGYNTNNVTLVSGNRKYTFFEGDPSKLLNTIFADKNNYPPNARNAIKNNRNIKLTIRDGEKLTFEKFVERLKNSFNDKY